MAVVLDERRKLTVAGDAPILQLDTGGHMGLIKGLAFTPDGRYLVSAGDDKVIRVWDWQAGTTVRSIRGQAGAGDEGKVYAMALSPDGRWLAAGGLTAPARRTTHSASTISPPAGWWGCLRATPTWLPALPSRRTASG